MSIDIEFLHEDVHEQRSWLAHQYKVGNSSYLLNRRNNGVQYCQH